MDKLTIIYIIANIVQWCKRLTLLAPKSSQRYIQSSQKQCLFSLISIEVFLLFHKVLEGFPSFSYIRDASRIVLTCHGDSGSPFVSVANLAMVYAQSLHYDILCCTVCAFVCMHVSSPANEVGLMEIIKKTL